MSSFSDKLKDANASISSAYSMREPAAMTLSLEDMSIEAYSEDENWIKPDNSSFYDYYTEYYDDNFSSLDNEKGIVLSAGQINLTQEKNSQYIPFKINRHYDGFDLATTKLSFYWVNKLGNGSEIPAVDVYCTEDKLKFALLVDENMTAVAGDLSIEIHAEGTNSLGRGYLWKTKPSKGLNVIQALQIKSFIEPDETWQESFVEKLSAQANRAESAANRAESAASTAEGLVINLQNGLSEEVNAIISEDYYTKNEVDSAISSVDVSSQLVDYAKSSDVYTKTEVDKAIAGVDVSGQLNDYATKIYVQEQIEAIPNPDLSDYALKTEIPVVPENVSAFTNDAGYLTEHQDISGKSDIGHIHTLDEITDYEEPDLSGFALKEEIPSVEGLASETYVQEEIRKIDITDQLDDYYTKDETYNKNEIDAAIDNVEVDLTGYATEKYVGEQISPINTAITSINQALDSVDKTPNAYYHTTYNEPYTFNNVEYTGENTLVVYETINKGKENETSTVVSAHVITGGSGEGTSNIIKIERVTPTPLVVTTNDDVVIEYTFVGTDSSGEDIEQGNATWKIGSQTVLTESVYTGTNSVNLTDYIGIGSDQKVTLIITDEVGTIQQKTWYVSVVDVKIESNFDDTKKYIAGQPVTFSYIPYGAIDKTAHYVLDGREIATVPITKGLSGLTVSYPISAQEHGSHTFEVYMTATINNNDIESNHIVKDIIWFDEEAEDAVIGCTQQEFTARQHETTNITYTVYSPSTENPTVTLKAIYIDEEGNTVEEYNSTLILTETTNVWSYKTSVIGEHTLTITCDNVVKTLKATITKLGIEVTPITAGLEFDFNPVGYSNNDENRIWTDKDTGVTMTLSDNFDWINGGYQMDENGDQYFCVKAGTTATVNYNLFADDAKANGKEFKVVFRTKNIRRRNTSFLSCLNDGIGLDMKIENVTIYSNEQSMKFNYCEDEIIEYEFNINKDSDMMTVMTYEDGTPGTPFEYTSTTSFRQITAKPITIGSTDCDVHIYRMKAYSSSLSDKDIFSNFIADARNAEEMIARHTRNQIYDENNVLITTTANGGFSAEPLMKAAPGLRYIFLEVPQFTNDKDNKIDGCTVWYKYPLGTRPQDNWVCTGMRHRGQGTSSNLYGYAGRNIDLVMDRSTSMFTWEDEDGKIVESSTITLTDTSIPTDYLNIKVNIASSENTNNAEMARRFNQFQPFLRYARKKDSRVKDTMEFFNCVVFIRETNEDLSTHREFNDNNWHFYAIGNVGDSKKTDNTRVNNPNDPKEFVVEIMDVDKPLAAFPTGKENNTVCPISEWKPGNTSYDILYSTEYKYDEEGEFESFGQETYEFRYQMDGITEEQRETNINVWRELYKFIVTSSDVEFYANLKNYFVVDSALYYYLFTERYTMVDNRCKNSFWHYGKVYISNVEAAVLGETEASYYIIDDEMAAINDGYRFDLTFFYDADTALGIDNTGDFVFSYGKEDTDYYVDGDPSSGYVFRAAESTFFCRLRDLFPSEMIAMYKDRGEKGAWSANSLISQWDNAQSLFPEELWRLDYQRKYYRTYLGLSIDNSIAKGVDKTFLIGKFFGRKKYSRISYETNQEIYYATRYFENKILEDRIWFRGRTDLGDSTIVPNYSLTITPYSDMYVTVQYGSTGSPIHQKCKAGESCTFINNSTSMDFVYIYAAGFIQALSNLSKSYIGDNNFSAGIRLQTLDLGSNEEGYDNPYMTNVLVDNNPLLEYLNISNISGINGVVNLAACGNLKEVYAEGTNASGFIFANGGLLETAYIPGVTSLTMKNLNHLSDFNMKTYENLTTLVIENCPTLDTYEMIMEATSLLYLRLIGINWDSSYNIKDTSVFNKLLEDKNNDEKPDVGGIDASNHETDISVVTGYAYVNGIKQYEYIKYKECWSDLAIEYGAMTPQFVVTFMNGDKVEDVQYVDQYGNAVDPITREDNPIITPVKESTIDKDYTFIGWDRTFTNVGSNIVVNAVFKETTRQYSAKYVQTLGNRTEILKEVTCDYGSYFYNDEVPTYTAEEQYSKFYLFNRWDKSGYIDGDKVITAIYDSCYISDDTYFEGKELADLSAVEIYALTRLIEDGRIAITTDESGIDCIAGTNISSKDSFLFTMGHDYNYDDLEDKTFTLIDVDEPRTFTGETGDYYDTGVTVLDMDRDFVLAVDYEFADGNDSGAVLMECYDQNSTRGFKLTYTSNPMINWLSTSTQCASGINREMLVLRHIAGEPGLHVYISNLSGNSIEYITLDNTITSFTTSYSIIFGCGRRTSTTYNYYSKGTVYWAKLWYTDLGDAACQKLASYIHENISLKIAGFNRYYLEDGEKLTSIDFIADRALYTKKGISNGSNVNGWASATLNTWLNNRFHAGLPLWVHQLVKKVKVKSRIGSKSSDISFSYCYIGIPAVSELINTSPYNASPYTLESDAVPICISHMTASERIMEDYNGEAVAYWTRSPSDSGAGNVYYLYISSSGSVQTVGQTTTKYGVIIELSF